MYNIIITYSQHGCKFTKKGANIIRIFYQQILKIENKKEKEGLKKIIKMAITLRQQILLREKHEKIF